MIDHITPNEGRFFLQLRATFESLRNSARKARNARERKAFESDAASILDAIAVIFGDKRPDLVEIGWRYRTEIASGAQFDRRSSNTEAAR
jgi:hypothetical protein